MRFLKAKEYREILYKGIPEDLEEDVGWLFYENTKVKRIYKKYYGVHLANITQSPYFVQRMLVPFKVYNVKDYKELEIPKLPNKSIGRLIKNRESIHSTEEHYINFKILSGIVHYSYGILSKKRVKIIDEWSNEIDTYLYKRPIPSAGALYPLEIYILSLRVEKLEPGIYHYNPFESRFERISEKIKLRVLEEQVFEIFTGLPESPWSAGIVISAIPNRQLIKYFNRSFRYIFIEAGHLAQTICLLATGYGFGVLPIGGYYDNELIELLKLDEGYEIPIYPLFIGKPGEKSKSKIDTTY